MTVITAQNALIAHLQAMPDRPALAYPNGTIVEALPRIVIQTPGPSQRNINLCGETEADVEISARVETEDGELAGDANDIVEAIIAHFPIGTLASGVAILERPRPTAPYRNDYIYHVPVIIRGRYYF